jgi:predicted nucleic acid-binding protein
VTFVVDSTVLIDHLRGEPRARRLIDDTQASSTTRIVASVMTRVEILAGARTGEESAISDLLATLEWIPVDEAIADRAGSLAKRYLRSHPAVDPVDFVIAATAEMLNAELWTTNVKHFPMFLDLRDAYAGLDGGS